MAIEFKQHIIKIVVNKWLEEALTFDRRVPDRQAPGFVEERRLQTIHVSIGESVIDLIEERELVVDLGYPVILATILSFSNLVYFLLKFFQS